MIEALKSIFNLKDVNPAEYSSLDLAYIGDCAYEIVIRTLIVSMGNTAVEKLNKKASSLAKASTQSEMILAILDDLSEEEQAVFKRGRNAKANTSAKNASINDYRRATGFEALIGWLYLKKDFDRMMAVIKLGLERIAAASADDPEATPQGRVAAGILNGKNK
ncbi:MAG: ribonuclease III [Lachnospiraceae bacterium]|nr:ribonuclease III [Lachnospiraceae bacterium]